MTEIWKKKCVAEQLIIENEFILTLKKMNKTLELLDVCISAVVVTA